MSRSFKRTPIVKDHRSGKPGKKFANRKVRRCKEHIANGKAYKKVFNSWDIHDVIIRYTWSQFKRRQESEEKAYINGANPYWAMPSRYRMDENSWARYYRRK